MITVIKRSGERVPLDISKIQRQVANACRGIEGVSPSMIEIKAQIELHDGIEQPVLFTKARKYVMQWQRPPHSIMNRKIKD